MVVIESDIKDCDRFSSEGELRQVIDNWKRYTGISATYAFVTDYQISRLRGASDILYVGEGSDLGRENNGRFWTYKYPNTEEKRKIEWVKQLVNDGHRVMLYLCREPPEGLSHREYERKILSRYEEEHWELPPFNKSR